MAQAGTEATKPRRRRRRWLSASAVVVGSLVVLAVVVRLLLDPIATRQTRQALDELEGFTGDFERVHVTILPPGYEIENLELFEGERAPKNPEGARGPAPLVFAKQARVDLDWRALFRLRLAASLRVVEPKLTVVQRPPKAPEPRPAKRVPDLSTQLEKVLPAKVNRVEVLDGEILFRQVSEGEDPKLWIHELAMTAENFATRRELMQGRPATIAVRGTVGRSGALMVFVSADPLASPLAFSGEAKLEGLRASELYAFLADAAKLQATKGTIDLFASFTSKEGLVTGGVKPVLKNLEIRPSGDGVFTAVKAWLADLTVELASDRVPGRNAVATTIPIKGKLLAPDVQLVPAILGVVRNAFVEGLVSGFANLPPETAPEKEGLWKQAANALQEEEGPPSAQPRKD